ncbi:hypothetical protein DYB25_000611 [Aphanomyces astaci]|uniref:Uncharacterized protein n=1 Tax=Aphanomyces astaci TaxID=112090 RepID=A0A397DD10_APHAT|nr:hypothetical protein DYB25_000611 [Aphanomyces astaci]RHY18005.1 hypothetical protein DYB36_001175 [Aphanomyces astaci]RHY59877.1 hypothetical protein DYB38_001090 [Aphanomyces astaci]RHY65169.1 hypothetical protein DYB30_001286 [Aphanomyces astaci]RHZ20863.1 hypothetical protein DYB26_000743 [Aphanomyces astaci]
MGASDATAPALDLAVDSAMSLTTFCNTPACVQNLQALYMNLPNCVGPNGLNIQKLNLYTTDILCDTLPPALLTQSPSERCTEVDLAVLEFLWMFPPWKNCTSKLLGPPLAQLMTGNASQTAAFCAAPACVEYANSIFQRMPSCTNNSTLQVGWANLGANSKSDLLAKLSATSATWRPHCHQSFDLQFPSQKAPGAQLASPKPTVESSAESANAALHQYKHE